MSDLFKVNAYGFTSDGYHSLNGSCLKSMYVFRGICVLICTLLIPLPTICMQPHVDMPVFASILVVYVLLVAFLLISPLIFYKRYRYKMDSDKVDIRKGVLWITHLMVPIERIHQVDVIKGPINRLFGLADVRITTAGGTAVIQYLEEDVAEQIVEHLNNTVVALLRDRV